MLTIISQLIVTDHIYKLLGSTCAIKNTYSPLNRKQVLISPTVFIFRKTSTLSSVDQPLNLSLDLCVTDRSVVPVRRVLLIINLNFITRCNLCQFYYY